MQSKLFIQYRGVSASGARLATSGGMQLRWLTLTLAACSLAASGCFEAHGLGADAGTRPDSGGADSGGADSGMCAPTLGSVYELRCTPPAFPGGSARVTIVGV
ncbi:MAG: hypothetical protein K8H88_34415, partial [Sandaracinaceae bacterium]|nr:hypothetical protein [Sandaracinaceae bacterium]